MNKKIILSGVILMVSFTYAGGFTAIISNQSTQQYKTDKPNNEPPIDDVMPDKNLIMTVGLHKPWSSGYHRGYNYSTSSARPTQLGDLNPNSQAEYRICALTSYTEPGYSNTVLEIDGNYTTTGDRYIDAFEVEWVGYQKVIYKNQEKYLHPSEGGVSFSEFRPDNDASVGDGLNGWLSINNGSNIDVIIKEIGLN